MAAIILIQSEGFGEALGGWDYPEGHTFDYWPLAASGYDFLYALVDGVKIEAMPLKLISRAQSYTVEVFYGKTAPAPIPPPPSLPDKPAPSYPAPSGEEVQGSIGKRCDFLRKVAFGGSWFAHRDRYTDAHSPWRRDIDEARREAANDAACFADPPPSPADWQTGIESTIKAGFEGLINYAKDGFNAIGDRINSIIGSIEAIKAGLSDTVKRIEGLELIAVTLDTWFVTMFDKMRDKIIDWVSAAALDILERVLNSDKP